MDVDTFERLVAEEAERERIFSWTDLQEVGVVQLLGIEKRNSRYGNCFLARGKTLTGIDVRCWVSERFLSELRRKFKQGLSVYFTSRGQERFVDNNTKGNTNRVRNCYELQLVRDGRGIPQHELFGPGVWVVEDNE